MRLEEWEESSRIGEVRWMRLEMKKCLCNIFNFTEKKSDDDNLHYGLCPQGPENWYVTIQRKP